MNEWHRVEISDGFPHNVTRFLWMSTFNLVLEFQEQLIQLS